MNWVYLTCEGIEAPPWGSRFVDICHKILNLMGIDNREVSLLLCNDERIQELNYRYRDIDRPTDVLSFGQGDNFPHDKESHSGFPFGDVVISLDTLMGQAEKYNVDPAEEAKRLLIHGLLHLGGMKHENKRSKMIRLQEKLLNKIKEETLF